MDPERPQAGAAAKPVSHGEDDLLGVIADVEKQLDSLRSVRVEREEQKMRFAEREAAIRAAESGVEEARRQLAQREAEINAHDVAIRESREQVERDLRALADEQQKSAATAQAREADVAARAATVEQREQRLAESAAAVSREREAIEGRAADLGKRENELRAAAAVIDRERQRISELTGRADKAETLVKELGAEIASLRQQAQVAAKRIEELGSEADAVRAEAQRRADAAAALKSQLEAKSKEHEAATNRAAAAERKAAAQEERAAKSEARITEVQSEIAERESRIQELTQRLDAAKDKFRSVSKSLQEQADLVGQANALEAELRQKDTQIAELQAKTARGSNDEAVLKAADKRMAEMKEQIDDLGRRLEETTHAHEQSRHQAEELRAQLKDKPGQKASDERIVEMKGQIDELTRRLDEAAKSSDQFRKQADDLKGQLKEHAKQAAKRSKSQGQIPTEVGQAVVTRWRRLRIMRTLLHEQGEKLRNGGEALRSRFEQCEQLLAQRDELLAARNALNESKKRVERLQVSAARGKAVAAVFHAIGILAALGGISWACAGELAPATYVARTVIAADTRGKNIAEDQLTEWQKYHDSLLTDPRIIEVAADRMSRRGIASLATPGALTQRLTADMTHESGVAGQLTIELRGRGAAKATRDLETYVNAVVSQANAGKEHRADGLTTIIAEAPNTLGGPVSDGRPIYAAGIFGVSLALTSLFGMVIWKRLSAVKVRFEHDEQIDTVLTNAAWEKAAKVSGRP